MQFGASWSASAARSTSSAGTSTKFVTELASGGRDRPPVAPATVQRKVACLRSFSPPARARSSSSDPTAALARAQASQRLPQCSPATRCRSC